MKKLVLFILISLCSFFCFSQDPIVSLKNANSSFSVIEGNTYEFTVSINLIAATDVIIDVTTISNTADNSDYTPISTTVTIQAGQLNSNILSIPTTNDAIIELPESFAIDATVTSSNTQNSFTKRSIGIWDNDKTPTLRLPTAYTINEGQSRAYTFYLSNPFNSDVTIDFTTISGSADSSDYNEINTSETIAAGEISVVLNISTIQDGLVELDETYTINATITSGNTTNNSNTFITTIIDDDTTPTLLPFHDYQISEGNTSSLFLSLSRPFNTDIDLQLTTSNGTADNSDYTAINETRTITAGVTGIWFEVPTSDDSLDEPVENFNITATVTSGNTTNTIASGTVDIIDNDGIPDVLIISVPTPTSIGDSIDAEEGYPIKFYARLTHSSPMDTDIVITTTDGSADNTDYTTSILTHTIPAGQVISFSEELSYPTILDQLDESEENLFITANITSGNTFDTSYSKEAFILNNYGLNAQPDEVISVLQVGTTFQILDNDTFEGLPVIPINPIVSLIETNAIGVTLDPSGLLSIPTNVPYGAYSFDYEMCNSANPDNCDTATINIRIISPLEAYADMNYVDFNGDGFISVGDIIEYDFLISNIGNTDITNIYPDVFFSTFEILGGPLANLSPGQTDTTTFTATHIITQNNINFGYVDNLLDGYGVEFEGTYYGDEVSSGPIQPNLYYELMQSDGLKLNAFVDTNGNGTQESDEINFPLGEFEYEVNNDGILRYLYVSPHYLYESDPSTTYDLNYVVDNDYTSVNTTSSNYSNVSVLTGSGITEYNFPITASAYDDLSISIYSCLNNPVPGFNYTNYITYTNNSSEVINSGTVNFAMDDVFTLIETSPNDVTINTAGFSYNFSDLEPYESRTIFVKMEVATIPTVNLGDLITNSADIELLPGDINPTNNTSSLTQTIVGSYDPNDVTERHGPEIIHSEFTTDDYLTYTIRFENTGTANAINIRVEDLLDEQLDESTLKMVNASHQYTLERVGKDLEWNFFGIDLPPSEDDDSPIGHGYITFKIKPFPDFAIGDIIPNTAEIYFDFNPAIVTNTWTTEFVEENLSVTNFSFESLKIHPTPTKNTLYIKNNTLIETIKVTSILGQQIMTKEINDRTANVDLSEIDSGIYFVTLSSNGNEKTVKIIKE
ncbi:DUF7619 domain-containing protein [Psychroserpens ponticola]|uniref:T9SS type A sorting domain-containing protein n=1 Tax=Psychroserpens ponticola TaxID=2932268 RepID=A0ABY7RTP5_9FLAO|nr:Calx-beta domain-containing protein [Psychroserpens ponticola]WCO00476.1 T9SS type A sorting domain-containing protein [Psychroserpens ponticola]